MLYALDRYQVSLKAYYELTQITKDLPRRKKKIGGSFDVEAYPGEKFGSQTSLINELKRDKRKKVQGIGQSYGKSALN